jgi:thiamine pyrophosphokinase
LPKRALIICNGEPPSRELVRRLARQADLIVAADGGANAAREYGIHPHVIIGDLDSITQTTQRFFSSSTILCVDRQDNTDLEKALDYVASRKIRKAVVIGATGKRIDFTLGNLSVLWAYTAFLDLTFIGDGWMAIPVRSKVTLRARLGTIVSLIPFGSCSGITLKGLQYPLTNASMNVGEIGVSNAVRNSPFTVRVNRGHMLLLVMEIARAIRRRT